MDEKKILKALKDKECQISKLRGKTSTSPEFKEWHESVKRLLRRVDNNSEKDFAGILFYSQIISLDKERAKLQSIEACNHGLDSASALLKSIIEDLELFGDESKNENLDNTERPIDTTAAHSPTKRDINININMTQEQNQSIAQSINLEEYNQETQRIFNDLLSEISKAHQDKEKIKKIFKYLSDKALDILIALVLNAAH